MSNLSRRQVLALLGLGGTGLVLGKSFGLGLSSTTIAGQALVLVPANPGFVFGSNLSNKGVGEASRIQDDYWIGQYQVTNAQYQSFLNATKRSAPNYWKNGRFPEGKADHPVLFVSGIEAQGYCDWLSSQDLGFKFRLPTEAEWENAARGPNNYSYPWGNSAGTVYANGVLTSKYNYNAVCSAYYLATAGSRLAVYNNKNSSRLNQFDTIQSILKLSPDGGVSGWIDHATFTGFVYTDVFGELSSLGGFTRAVGSFPDGASYYGCFDMAGNAFEWTGSLVIASNGAEAGKSVNAVRGGSWYSTGRSCQTSYRGEGRDANGGYNTVGFRVVAK
jgi:formylglycine-generating enzyme required for sulfatase activity